MTSMDIKGWSLLVPQASEKHMKKTCRRCLICRYPGLSPAFPTSFGYRFGETRKQQVFYETQVLLLVFILAFSGDLMENMHNKSSMDLKDLSLCCRMFSIDV